MKNIYISCNMSIIKPNTVPATLNRNEFHIFMPPTLKMLVGHIAFGLSVRVTFFSSPEPKVHR